MTKLEAIKELVKHDHEFLTPEFAKAICEPFGIKAPIYLAKANPQDFKGLSLYDDNGNPISEAEGANAHTVAEMIAKLYGFTPFTQGIGSRLRTSCEFVERVLSKTKTPPGSEVE